MRATLLLMFAVAILAGCSSSPERAKNNVFKYNEASGISSLDPAYAREQSSIWAVHQIFNGLVQMDSALNIQPAIAKRWEVLDSGKTYRFYLRNDVYFHQNICFGRDGTRRVTAQDFTYSFLRILEDKTASPGRWVFTYVDSFSSINDSVLEIKLKQAFAPFLGLLTTKYASVVPSEAIEKYGVRFGQNPVGTGPFYLKAWIENEKMVLRRNPKYFETENGQPLPYLEAIAIGFVKDKQAAFLEFAKGNNHIVSGLDASYKDEILTPTGKLKPEYEGRVLMQRMPYLNTEYLGIVVDDPKSPLAKKEVRQALNFAINREAMMRYLRNGIGIPAHNGIVPMGIPSFDPEMTGYTYRPAKARELLASAGYGPKKPLPEIPLFTTSDYLDISEFVQEQWGRAGIKSRVEVLPASMFRERKAKAALPIFRASWIADYPDAENYLSLFYSPNFTPNGPNYTHYQNPAFDSIYRLANVEINDSIRHHLYRKAEAEMMEDAPVIPLFYDEVVRFLPKNIRGLPANPLNMLELKRARFVE